MAKFGVASLIKGIPTHVTLDNNDGSQETLTGKGTTHDTNFTVFQPVLKNEVFPPVAEIEEEEEETLVLLPDINEVTEVPEYNFGQRKPPPLFKNYVDNKNRTELEKSLKKDLIWAIAIGLNTGENEDAMIGSWTDFKKQTTLASFDKSLLEYLPAVAQPPDYPVCKKFLDDLLNLLEDLNLGHIFCHSDEQVYAKLTQIMWKDPGLYKDVVVLMGGFHQLRVRQKTIYKRHAVKGYQTWCTDAKTIAVCSAGSAIEGRHYYR